MNTFTRNPVYEEYVKLTGFDKKPVQSLADCAARLASLGIDKALVSGRDIESTYAAPASNDLVDACVAAYPSLFIGIHGYDPHKGMTAYKAMRRAIREQRSRGASIEPSMAHCPMDDARYYPLYALCCDYDVPVLVTAGLSPNMPKVLLSHSSPLALDKVAADFPDLRILASHGGYPWVNETIAVCLRHRNIYIDFSSSINKPMGEEYIKAANGCLADRFVFSSAHPFADVADALEQARHIGLSRENLEKMFSENARRLLGSAQEII
ncbi:MAG: amidohydrolase family protein [Desulfovibrionaceae bacterium]|nr:amidohydrolase family protein [Desulfovibrionaceae bacterium]